MTIPFSERPGRHERHYRRKLKNSLFPEPFPEKEDESLLEVQRLDHEEILAFLTELRATVQRAVDLRSNEESQVVLDLKADLDRLYETACGLADDQEGNKTAIRQLLAVIMDTVRRSAKGDSMAEQELEQEELARATHFSLLEQPIVSDVLHPESVIGSEELVPTLLCEQDEALESVLEIFDAEQLGVLCGEAESLLRMRDPDGILYPDAARRLARMERVLAERQGVN